MTLTFEEWRDQNLLELYDLHIEMSKKMYQDYLKSEDNKRDDSQAIWGGSKSSDISLKNGDSSSNPDINKTNGENNVS